MYAALRMEAIVPGDYPEPSGHGLYARREVLRRPPALWRRLDPESLENDIVPGELRDNELTVRLLANDTPG